MKELFVADSVNLDALSTRSGFNSAVRYITKTLEIAARAEDGNLGDILHELKDVEASGRTSLLLRMLLVDKLGYKTASVNLCGAAVNLDALAGEFQNWNGVDLVAAYHHPELGLLIANPKVPHELAVFGSLKKHELLVVYAGLQGGETGVDCQRAASLAIKLFEGKTVAVPPALTVGKFAVKKKQKKETQGKGAKAKNAKTKTDAKKTDSDDLSAQAKLLKMTPRYAVVVQNEFFHNGNVEAWKRIIASYKAKHPNLEVFIYYEGERILDINSLFQWGKVKHGCAVEFAVAGHEIKDVAKLQRYLAHGASNQFEAFLRGSVNSVLKLF